MHKRKGFTLIELLVVISVIAVLMAILMPSLNRAREQARTIGCRSNLRQWGIAATTYAHEYGDRLVAEYDQGIWVYVLKPYMGYSDEKTLKTDDVSYCPSANKPQFTPEGLLGPGNGLGPRSAWGVYGGSGYLSGMAGSYGFNAWIYRVTIREKDGNTELRKQWGTLLVRGANRIPLIGGCYRYAGYPEAWHDPPEYEVGAEYVGLGSFAVNRHAGSINMAFLDGSARKVGLKELWALSWHREYNADYATRRGIQWPEWMKNFKGYDG